MSLCSPILKQCGYDTPPVLTALSPHFNLSRTRGECFCGLDAGMCCFCVSERAHTVKTGPSCMNSLVFVCCFWPLPPPVDPRRCPCRYCRRPCRFPRRTPVLRRRPAAVTGAPPTRTRTSTSTTAPSTTCVAPHGLLLAPVHQSPTTKNSGIISQLFFFFL